MAKKQSTKVSEKQLFEAGWYKGYDMHWLRQMPSHSDFHLVAEYDKKKKKKA